MSNNTSQELVDNNRRIGRVEWYNPKRGFGFITTLIGEEGKDLEDNVFVHVSNLVLNEVGNQAYKKLNKFDVVEFNLGRTEDGKFQAVNITGVRNGPLPCQGTTYMPMVVRYGGNSNNGRRRENNNQRTE